MGSIQDAADAPAGYALVNGRRAVYILATKRAEASTLSVINNIKDALPKMKEALGAEGEGIDVRFEFDQSPYVTRAVGGVVSEGVLGAGACWPDDPVVPARLAQFSDRCTEYSSRAFFVLSLLFGFVVKPST